MFGDTEKYKELAESALELFDLEELLEMNDLDDVSVVALLISRGLIDTYDDYETPSDDND